MINNIVSFCNLVLHNFTFVFQMPVLVMMLWFELEYISSINVKKKKKKNSNHHELSQWQLYKEL